MVRTRFKPSTVVHCQPKTWHTDIKTKKLMRIYTKPSEGGQGQVSVKDTILNEKDPGTHQGDGPEC